MLCLGCKKLEVGEGLKSSSGQEAPKLFLGVLGPEGQALAKSSGVTQTWLAAVLLPNCITCLLTRSPEQMSEQGGDGGIH